jgi:hypothetical protein
LLSLLDTFLFLEIGHFVSPVSSDTAIYQKDVFCGTVKFSVSKPELKNIITLNGVFLSVNFSATPEI